ncbi:MAG: hypothetical protein WED11_03595 [Natronospirillum sp.]
MKSPLNHFNLWLPTVLFVLVAPSALNTALNAAASPQVTPLVTTGSQAVGRSSLPATLPARITTPALTAHHQVVNNHIYRSHYSNVLGATDEGLVPYISRLYSLDNYTQTQLSERTINHSSYNKALFRRKYSNQTYVAYYQFQVGRITTNTYTKAKLYQLPAALMGAQEFSVVIWQQACSQSTCTRESEAIEGLLARQETRPIARP